MSNEIETYDPSGKCERCMGSGHFIKTVSKPMEYVLLVFHCPICNGTGLKPVVEHMLEEAALRERGLIEGVKMDIDLHKLCVEVARAMLDMDVTRHISYVNGLDIPGVFKDGGKIIKVTVEFVDEDETRDDADSVS